MVLGLDLATRSGFCWGVGDRLPVVGHYDLPRTGEDVGPFLIAAERWIEALLDRVKPELVCFEAPVLSRATTTLVTRKLHALPGLVEMACWRRRLPVTETGPSHVKKVLTGFGTAGKDEMIAAAEAYGLTITCSDEADAFGVWLAAIRRRRPQFAARWSPIGARALA